MKDQNNATSNFERGSGAAAMSNSGIGSSSLTSAPPLGADLLPAKRQGTGEASGTAAAKAADMMPLKQSNKEPKGDQLGS